MTRKTKKINFTPVPQNVADEFNAFAMLNRLTTHKRGNRRLELRVIREADGSAMVQVNDGVQYREANLRLAVASALAGETLK